MSEEPEVDDPDTGTPETGVDAERQHGGPASHRRRGAFGPAHYAAIFGGLAVVVAGLIVAAVWLVGRMGSAPALPDGIQFVLPPPGGAMLSQDRVGVQTNQSWSCTLVIDGIRIPESEHVGVKELGECFFQAGPGKIIEEFAPGRHQVQATVFPLVNPDDTQMYFWSFQTQ